jgi:DNA mismatch repair protein MutH
MIDNALLNSILSPYISFSVSKLKKHFNIFSDAKNINYLIIKKIFNRHNFDIKKLKDNNLVIKSIRKNYNGKVVESVSFSSFKFEQIINETWNESTFLKQLNNRFVFLIFSLKDNEYIFEKFIIWEPNIEEISEAKRIWLLTQKTISSGNIIKKYSNITENYFPKAKDSWFIHIRPHARNANDTYRLPVPDLLTGKTSFTKQSFWINASFLNENIIT